MEALSFNPSHCWMSGISEPSRDKHETSSMKGIVFPSWTNPAPENGWDGEREKFFETSYCSKTSAEVLCCSKFHWVVMDAFPKETNTFRAVSPPVTIISNYFKKILEKTEQQITSPKKEGELEDTINLVWDMILCPIGRVARDQNSTDSTKRGGSSCCGWNWGGRCWCFYWTWRCCNRKDSILQKLISLKEKGRNRMAYPQ